MLERNLFQRMAGARGIEHVIGQHRVELEPRQFDAMMTQHHQIEFQIVSDLLHGRIFKHRFQRGQRLPGRKLGRGIEARVAQRKVRSRSRAR